MDESTIEISKLLDKPQPYGSVHVPAKAFGVMAAKGRGPVNLTVPVPRLLVDEANACAGKVIRAIAHNASRIDKGSGCEARAAEHAAQFQSTQEAASAAGFTLRESTHGVGTADVELLGGIQRRPAILAAHGNMQLPAGVYFMDVVEICQGLVIIADGIRC